MSSLAPGQRAAWLRCRLDPAWAAATARSVRVTGELDPAVVRERLAGLLGRHPELAVAYADDGGEPVPVPAELDLEISAGPAVPEWAGAGPADPAGVAAVRVRLHRLGAADWVLGVLAHPVAVDPAALPGLVRELLGAPAGAGWRPYPEAQPVLDRDRDFWAGRLAGELGLVDLTGRPGRPAPAGGRGPAVPVAGAAVEPSALLTAVALLLRRYTGVADVPLLLPVPGGAVVLRVAAGAATVAEVRDGVAAGLREALAHRSVPVTELPLPRAGGPAVRVTVALGGLVAPGEDEWGTAVALGTAAAPVRLRAATVSPLPVAAPSGPTDLLVLAGPGPALSLAADPATVPPEVVRWLAADLPAVLAADGPVADVLPVAAGERRAPAAAVDDSRFPAAELERSIPARFADVAARHPDRPAVLGDDRTLTYAELAAAAAAVTAAVRAVPPPGGGDRGRVGLLLDHGVDTVTAIVGVLGAGRAYVPLDPAYPVDRLAAAVADAGAGVLVTTAGHRPLAADLLARAGRTAAVLDLGALPAAEAGPPADCGPDTPAYVLYTSGSTGRPKGVVQAHHGVLFQARQHALAHGITAADRVGVLTSFGFDASVTDLFTALLTGAAAVPVDVRRHGLRHLVAALRDRGVTVYHSPPTLYRYLVGSLGPGERLDRVRVVLLGGEELTRPDVEAHRRHFAPGSLLVNGYGATEVSFALQDRRTAGTPLAGEVVPIGRPLDGLDVVLLGPDGRPACLAGEIAVRGRAVALGYRDRPAEQAERFTDLGGGVREYRTGDLGRRLPDGRIAYAGRRDRQVKIRGYRVEPGEVEAVLGGLPGVAQAAAVARPERAGGTLEVVAYAVPRPGVELDGSALRAALSRCLPHFSVPRAVVVLAALPLTATGKVDTGALPAPAAPVPVPAGGDGGLRAVVAGAWCAALGVPAVGDEDNFFELGGHSLLLARVQQALERELDRRIPLHRLFEHPTVAALSDWLAEPAPAPAGSEQVRERMDRRRDARSRRPVPRRSGG